MTAIGGVRLRVDPTLPEAPYAQLRDQIIAKVARGELVPGDRLPPVRRLADDLGLAPNTVAHAYRELDADGVTEGRGRKGTFVRASLAYGRTASAGAAARDAAQRYADLTSSLGLSREDALKVVEQVLGHQPPGRPDVVPAGSRSTPRSHSS